MSDEHPLVVREKLQARRRRWVHLGAWVIFLLLFGRTAWRVFGPRGDPLPLAVAFGAVLSYGCIWGSSYWFCLQAPERGSFILLALLTVAGGALVAPWVGLIGVGVMFGFALNSPSRPKP